MTVDPTEWDSWLYVVPAPLPTDILDTFTVLAHTFKLSISHTCILVFHGLTTIYVFTPLGNVKLGAVFR